jgi:hypothetical protein
MELKDLVREKWAEKALAITSPPEDVAKLASARKEILRIINWEVNDDRHRKIDQIKDTATYICRILSNVLDNPQDEKFRRVSHLEVLHAWSFNSSPTISYFCMLRLACRYG